MSQGVGVVGLYVRDQDEALKFYVEKLGFRVHTDARNGDYRWLTVQHPDQPSFQLGLFKPQPPTVDEATAQTLREIVAKGAMPPLVLVVDDCRAAYEQLRGARRRIHPGAHRALRQRRRQLPRSVRKRMEDDRGAVRCTPQFFRMRPTRGTATSPSREVSMNWSKWIRQFHRWMSITFTAVVDRHLRAAGRGAGAGPMGLFPAAAAALPADVLRALHVRAALCRSAARRRSRGDGCNDRQTRLCSPAAIRRSRRAMARRRCRPISRPCRAGSAPSGAGSTP